MISLSPPRRAGLACSLLSSLLLVLGLAACAATDAEMASSPPPEADGVVVADGAAPGMGADSAPNLKAGQAVEPAPQAPVPAPVAESAPPAPAATSPAAGSGSATRRFLAGTDPEFAARMGWPVEGPAPLPGAILPHKRIVAFYGNPLSRRMGVLGEYDPEEMLRRFDLQVDEWRRADPETPVQPALHLVAVVAQGEAGSTGKYRSIMRDTLVERVYEWARSRDGILFIDIQAGHSDIRELLPRFDHFLTRPDVHLGIDPEFMMKTGHVPGTKIGTMDAADINYATEHLAKLVREHNLPPKVLVIHRFTRGMVTNASQIRLRPEVQIVMHMDGWGAPWLKRDSYRDFIVREPVQFAGFKLFYHNDTKAGDPLMTPFDLLQLRPLPFYIQYQ